jgi:hypothetical protein
MALQVNWQQQQSAQQQPMQQQQQQMAQPQSTSQQPGQQPMPDVLVVAKQMGLWELSRGGNQEFQSATEAAQQPWVDLLQRCCRKTGHMFQQIKDNARVKAELLDHPEWQLGVQYEPGTARTGYQDTPW